MRGDAWAVTIPGLPWVPGGSSEQPERCLTWFFDRWTSDWQSRILEAYHRRQYSHFVLSAPDSIQGYGQTLAQFVRTCETVRNAGFYPVVFLGSKLYQPRDMSVKQWISYVSPILHDLLDVCDEVVPGWEWDL